MKAKLVSPVSSPPDWEIDLEQFPIVIGRSPDAEIQPLDESVSERHCELEAINGQIKERMGSCDINLVDDGVQLGIPTVEEGVYVHAMVTDKLLHEFEFVEGWCQCDTP